MTKGNRYYAVWQLLQSVTGITKCERKLLQSVTGITKCENKLLQSVMDIIMFNNFFKT